MERSRDLLREGLSEAWRATTICLVYDTLAAMAAMYAAFAIRNQYVPDVSDSRIVVMSCFELSISTLLAVILTGVYRQVWRHSTSSDLRRVAQAALLANLIFLPIMYFVNGLAVFPGDVFLFEIPILLLLMVGGRLVSRGRATGQMLAAFRQTPVNRPFAILVGASRDLAEQLDALAKSPEGLPVRPLGIIETSGAHKGRAISGVQVFGGLEQLDHMLSVLAMRYGKSPWIALAGNTRDRVVMDAVLEAASNHGATIQRLRRNGDSGLDPVRPTELLPRLERDFDATLAAGLINGARVFVTGAGGTIGGELVRQCAAYGPAEIVLFEASEYNLYAIDMALKEAFPQIRRVAYLGDVRDEVRVREAMRETRPDVVIHAAALKHVPLMETNPNEAILTNVIGARTVASAAADFRAKAFVFISTDKAVDPVNVMGASKRAAEIYLQALAPTCANTRFAMVRFGNVLGSAGSVAPLFERQIEAGGPVTVTDENMTRFFMSVEEASALVLQAAALAVRQTEARARLFVLDMGPPIRIVDLARRMIRLKGLRPDEDIHIEFTGLRPGEKMSEAVFYSEESAVATEVPGVMEAQIQPKDLPRLNAALDEIANAAQFRQRRRALDLLAALSPELARLRDGFGVMEPEPDPLAEGQLLSDAGHGSASGSGHRSNSYLRIVKSRSEPD